MLCIHRDTNVMIVLMHKMQRMSLTFVLGLSDLLGRQITLSNQSDSSS